MKKNRSVFFIYLSNLIIVWAKETQDTFVKETSTN